MADAKTINGYNVKDAAAREAIANLDTVKLASSGGASGSIRFGVDGDGNYGYYKAGADTVTPFKEGGDFEETVLWTNPDITSDFPLKTLSGLPDISQYDYIGVYCNRNTGITDEMFVAMDYEHFKNTKWDAGYPRLASSWYGSDYMTYTRVLVYVSDTSVRFSACSAYSSTAATKTANNTIIPTKIVGIKKGSAAYAKPIRVKSQKDSAALCKGVVYFDVTDYTSVTFTVRCVGSNSYFVSSGGTRTSGTYTDDVSNINTFWIGAYSYTNDTYDSDVYIDSIKFS